MSDQPQKPHHPKYALLPADYKVGYARPPVESQFKPSKSGNPKGRPKGSSSIDGLIRKVLFGEIKITENGKVKSRPALELVLRAQRNEALKGKTRAAAWLFDVAEKYDVELPAQIKHEIHISFVKPDPELVAQAEKGD